MIEARELDDTWNDIWDDFVGSVGAGLYHRTDWLKALALTRKLELLRLGFFRDGTLCGVVPLYITKLGPLSIAGSPFVVEDTPYLGVAASDSDLPEVLVHLVCYAGEKRISFLRLMQRQQLDAHNIPANFTVVEKHSHVLKLDAPQDDLWNRLEGRCRTAVRKAEKSGVTIVPEESPDCLAVYYPMLDSLYLNQRIATPNPPQLYTSLWKHFFPDRFRVLTARYGGRVVAGIILVNDGVRWYYLNGSSYPEYNNLNANNLLQWEAIKFALREGGREYDFVGSDIERLARFKKSFGGELVAYTCLEYAASPVVTIIRNYYPHFKNAVGRIRSRFAASWKS